MTVTTFAMLQEMHIVHVIPIARGVGKETLTYFTAHEAPIGSVVSVPLRKRMVPALVVEQQAAKDARAALRHAAYALRKTANKKPWRLLAPPFMEAVTATTRYHASTTGAVLHTLIPSVLWDTEVAEKISAHADMRDLSDTESGIVPERFILQAEEEERLSRYRGLVREAFARNTSAFIVVPTIVEGERIRAHLERGIETYIYLLHSSLSRRELAARWQRALGNTHPVVIIGTPPFLCLSRADLNTIVIERESAGSFRSHVRPYADHRVFVEAYARAKRARLVLADLPLRSATLWRHEQGELEALVPPKLHPRSGVMTAIIDMREKKPQGNVPKKKQPFAVISDELRAHIQKALTEKKQTLLYAARRGLSPITVCGDCGNVVTCENSNEPAVLYRGLEKNVFVCQSTGVSRSAEERCRFCRSWRLQSLGIGVQRIEDDVRKLFPEAALFTLDSDSASTHRQASATMEKFYATAGAILIGTEMVLPYLGEQAPTVAVISADTLLSHPEWHMSEKAFTLLIALRNRAAETFFIQTRRPDEGILHAALQGDTTGFYREEIERRKLLRYPPFAVLVKISAVGTQARVSTLMKELEEHFAEYKLRVYLPTVRVTTGRFAMHGLLRVPHNSWPDEKLLKLLRALPPHFTVQVNPEKLL